METLSYTSIRLAEARNAVRRNVWSFRAFIELVGFVICEQVCLYISVRAWKILVTPSLPSSDQNNHRVCIVGGGIVFFDIEKRTACMDSAILR